MFDACNPSKGTALPGTFNCLLTRWRRFFRPEARVELGSALVDRASAVIDVSDGLLGDLKKLLEASGVGAEIEVEHVPTSQALRDRFDSEETLRLALTGGDDYELCFTADAGAVTAIENITAIGTVTAEAGLRCLRDGVVVEFDDSGYRHFQ